MTVTLQVVSRTTGTKVGARNVGTILHAWTPAIISATVIIICNQKVQYSATVLCTDVRSGGGAVAPPSHFFQKVSVVPSKPIVLLEADVNFAMKFVTEKASTLEPN